MCVLGGDKLDVVELAARLKKDKSILETAADLTLDGQTVGLAIVLFVDRASASQEDSFTGFVEETRKLFGGLK